MLTGLHHIGVFTENIATSIDFYKTLGLALDKTASIPNGTEIAFMSVGSLVLELVQPADTASVKERKAGLVDHIAITVKDIDATITELKAKGIAIAADKAADVTFLNSKNIFFEGPSGERLELFEEL